MLAKNIYIWTLIVLFTFITVAVHMFVKLTPVFNFALWTAWGLLCVTMYWFTESCKELLVLFNDAYSEVKKVVWPTKQETVQTTLIVIIMVAVTGIMLWLLDNSMIWLIAKLARLG